MTTKKTATKQATIQPSIPAARLPEETVPEPNTKNRLKDRLKNLKTVPESKSTIVKRSSYEVPATAIPAIKDFIASDVLRRSAEKYAARTADEAIKILFKAFCEALWNNKDSVPANPKINIPDEMMSAIFQVHDRFPPNGMKLPDISPRMEEEEINEKIVSILIDAGVEADDAQNLVANEIKASKQHNIRSLNELVEGHYNNEKQWVNATPEEQSVADKLLDFIDTLTEEEQNLIRRDVTTVKVKSQFLSRVHQYAHHPAQVESILNVFTPVNFLANSTIDETTKVKKLQQIVDKITGGS